MIKISNLSKAYNDQKHVLFKNVNIEIPTNQLTFIVGPSGSGKTTLLKMIGNVEKFHKDFSVTLDLNGDLIDLRKKKNHYFTNFIFQDFNLFNNLNSLQNINISKRILGNDYDKKETIEFLETFDIKKESLLEKTKNLSAGESQRISIARAMNQDSQILLVDEPTSNLDEENTKKIFELLKKISKIKTVIVASHDLESANLYSDNIIEIKDYNLNYVKKSEAKSLKNDLNTDTSDRKIKPNFFRKIKNEFIATVILSTAGFKRRWIHFFFIFVFFFISLFVGMNALFLGFNNSNFTEVLKGSNVINLNKLTVFSDKPFSKNDFKKITSQKDIDKVVENYGNTVLDSLNIKFSYDPTQKNAIKGTNEFSSEYVPIDESDYFKGKIMSSNKIEGGFIKNQNDIIVSEDLVKKLNINNPIGKTIQVVYSLPFIERYSYIGGNEVKLPPDLPQKEKFIPLKIVGINKSVDDNNKPFVYVHENLIKNIKVDYTNNNNWRETIDISSNKIPYSYSSWLKQKTEILNGNEVFLDKKPGVDLTNSIGIFISSGLYKKLKINNFSDLYTANVKFNIKGIDNIVSVLGVFDDKEVKVKLNSNSYNLFTSVRPTKVDVYFSRQNNLIETKKNLETYGFGVSDPYQSVRDQINSQLNTFLIVSVLLSFFLGVITVLVSIVFSVINSSFKKDDIIAYRSLGIKTGKIWLVNMMNIIALNLSVFISSIILYYPLYWLIGTFVSFFHVVQPYPNVAYLWMFIGWSSLSFVSIVSYGIFSLIAFSTQSNLSKVFSKLIKQRKKY